MVRLHEEVRARDQQLLAAKQARRRAIEAAVSASWRRVAQAIMQKVLQAWMWVQGLGDRAWGALILGGVASGALPGGERPGDMGGQGWRWSGADRLAL